MTPAPIGDPAITGGKVCKTFRRKTGETVVALDDVSVEVRHGELTALVGPDGAGKTTLIRLVSGLMAPDGGSLKVLDVDVAADPQQIQDRIGYMPQKFGLYEDLSVQENLDLYADLHGISQDERNERYPRLMEMTALGPFTHRQAGRLSGGMKQKLGLACTLVRVPELLVLDEPTVGVDPLSRRELWEIVERLVDDGMSVLMSTSYLDEAERCEHVIVLREGKLLASGKPADITSKAKGRSFIARPPKGEPARHLQALLMDDPAIIDAVPQAGQVRFVRADDGGRIGKNVPELGDIEIFAVEPRFEDGFMMLLAENIDEDARSAAATVSLKKSSPDDQVNAGGKDGDVVVEVNDLVRMFGQFAAVSHVSFKVRRREIFGLLGPNGAGKTTTFRMLCGLLPATSGTLHVAGVDLHTARASARQRIGYVAQKFSLYGQLTVTENLDFFASAYGLHGKLRRNRLEWAMDQFELTSLADLPSGQLPGGYKQRLAMAAALMHEPDILFLDEPTSGADPLARREFWRRITSLSDQGVTVIITTHFMEEAEYCDRAVIQDAGRILAQGTPSELRAHAAGDNEMATMEDAFISIIEQARSGSGEALQAAE